MKHNRHRTHAVRSIALLLAILLLVPALFSSASAATPDSEGWTSHLLSSYNEENYLEFSVSGSTLTVGGLLQLEDLTDIMIRCGDEKVWLHNVFTNTRFSATFHLPDLFLQSGDPLPVSVYTKRASDDAYWTLSWDKVYVAKQGSTYGILASSVQDNNLAFANIWLYPKEFLSDQIPESVAAMSDAIVGAETDPYRQVWLLYQWTAENIYYDHDCLTNTPSSEWICDSAGVLEIRRSVCEGYASLLRDLIQAQGIPCMKSNTLSIWDSFALSTEQANALTPNHTHVEAYVDNRWVIMDPTWDSHNDYENGTFLPGSSHGFAYFDITPEMLALDHKMITRGDNDLHLDTKDGTLINDHPWTANSVPSSWAMDEVRQALRYGIVPQPLTQKYTENITRGEFCGLIMQMMMVRYGADSLDTLLGYYDLTMQENLFPDTNDPYVCAASLLGIVNGTGNGLFTPEREITREEAATMLGRLAKKFWIRTGENSIPFADLDQVSGWAKDSVLFVSSLSSGAGMRVMSGTGNNRFSPKGDYTVEQAILTAYRLLLT